MTFKEFTEKIDLSKRFPGYFNKPLLRGAMLIYFLLVIVSIGFNNWDPTVVYFECSLDSPQPCVNKFYESSGRVCNKYADLCTKEILQQGEVVGFKPPAITQRLPLVGLLIVVMAFILNDIIYRGKNGKNTY